MANVNRRTQETAIDVVNLIAGLVLAISPWILGFAGTGAVAWNAWIVGLLIALVAIGALVAFQQWEEWVNLVLGLWAVVSPFALGFSSQVGACSVHVVVGLVVAVLAAIELWMANNRPMTAI